MLDTLTDMEVANTIMKTTTDKKSDADAINVLDKRFQELSLKEMTPLEHKSPEYKALADYLIKSAGSSHNVSYRLEDIFRIERMGEADRFAKSEFADLKEGDRRLLWSALQPQLILHLLSSENLLGMAPERLIMVVFCPKVCELPLRRLL